MLRQKILYIDPLKDILFYTNCSRSYGREGDANALKRIAKEFPELARLAVSAPELQGLLYTTNSLAHLSLLKELFLVPSKPRPYGHAVFRDLSQPEWDRQLMSIICYQRYTDILKVEERLRDMEDEIGHCGLWVAPKLRIGMFCKAERMTCRERDFSS